MASYGSLPTSDSAPSSPPAPRPSKAAPITLFLTLFVGVGVLLSSRPPLPSLLASSSPPPPLATPPAPIPVDASSPFRLSLSSEPPRPLLLPPSLNGGAVTFGPYLFADPAGPHRPRAVPFPHRNYGPGPLILHARGSFSINFTNALEPLPAALLPPPPQRGEPLPPAGQGLAPASDECGYYSSNLHLHGYHGPFTGSHDNIHNEWSPPFVSDCEGPSPSAPSPSSGIIEYPLPDAAAEPSPHSHWLHPHLTGSSSHDLAGAFSSPGAAVFVLGSPDSSLAWLDRPELSLPLFLSTFNLRAGKSRSMEGLAKIAGLDLSGELPAGTALPDGELYLSSGAVYRPPPRASPSAAAATAAALLSRSRTLSNGLLEPAYPLPARLDPAGRRRSLQRLRLVSGTAGDVLNLRLPAAPAGGGECAYFELARDGVYLPSPREFKNGTVLLPPGGRLDVLLQCADVAVGDELSFGSAGLPAGDPAFVGAKSDVDGGGVLFSLRFVDAGGGDGGDDDGVSAAAIPELDLSELVPPNLRKLRATAAPPGEDAFEFDYSMEEGTDARGMKKYVRARAHRRAERWPPAAGAGFRREPEGAASWLLGSPAQS